MDTINTFSDYSKRAIRQRRILRLLLHNDAMSNYDLCVALGCSEATVRNDLRALDEAGLIIRTHGGAQRLESATHPMLDEFSMISRIQTNSIEKKAIGEYLLSSGLIKPNLSIVFDVGSTCYMAAYAVNKVNFHLNVALCSLSSATLLSKNQNITMALAGGIYNPTLDCFDNESSLNYFSNMYFDYFFMGANGVANDSGVTCTMQVAENRFPLKKLLSAHSEKTILLCDHTKINRHYINGVCGIKDLDLIITDDNCSDEERKAFLDLDTKVEFAPTEGIQ